MVKSTSFRDYLAVAARVAELGVEADQFDSGCNPCGSCSPGIGINADGGEITGDAQQFTLLDQEGAGRAPQNSQPIGGFGHIDRSSGWDVSSGGVEGAGTRSIAVTDLALGDSTSSNYMGKATLSSLTAGWVAA